MDFLQYEQLMELLTKTNCILGRCIHPSINCRLSSLCLGCVRDVPGLDYNTYSQKIYISNPNCKRQVVPFEKIPPAIFMSPTSWKLGNSWLPWSWKKVGGKKITQRQIRRVGRLLSFGNVLLCQELWDAQEGTLQDLFGDELVDHLARIEGEQSYSL